MELTSVSYDLPIYVDFGLLCHIFYCRCFIHKNKIFMRSYHDDDESCGASYISNIFYCHRNS